MFTRLAQVALFTLLATAATVQKRQASTCNGHPDLCTRSYSSVSYVGAHNSYAVDAVSLSANQEYDVTQQLNDGIRLLQLQAHDQDGNVNLCHESCFLFQGGLLLDYLGKVKSWLDDNPNEVLTILIVNRNRLPATTFAAVYEAAGLAEISFSPFAPTLGFAEWPTLGDMINAGTRLVTFIDSSADFASVPWIIDEFTNIWETPFDVTVQDFPCTIDRTNGDPASQMYLINHFLYTDTDIVGAATSIAPNKDQLEVTNAVSGFGSLGQEVETCQAQWSRPPTFLLVDFYHYGGGSVFQVAANINGVEYAPSSPVPDPLEENTSGGENDDVISRPLGKASSLAITGSSIVLVITLATTVIQLF